MTKVVLYNEWITTLCTGVGVMEFVTITFSRITSSGMTVTLERADNTFVVDYPVWCDFSDGSHIVSYNNPELIPEEIRNSIEEIIRYTREAEDNHSSNLEDDDAFQKCIDDTCDCQNVQDMRLQAGIL